MRPDAITCDLAGTIAQGFVARDLNAAGYGSQDFLESLLRIGFGGGNAGSIQFVHKSIRAVRPHNNLVGMQPQIIRAVFEDTAWRKKDEGKDYGNHHVVMKSAARVRPQNVALDGLKGTQEVFLDSE